MCYHTALTATPRQLALRFGRETDLFREFRPVYHVPAFNHMEYPIVTSGPEIEPMRWGLIPFWTESLEDALTIRNRTINARAETVFDKPSFREPVRRRRCLVPVTGFFDWRHEEHDGQTEKIPYFIKLKHEEIFSLAGIYDVWKNPENGEWVTTYSVLTTGANELMTFIHNTNFRMPVILPRDDEQGWLNPDLTQDEIRRYLLPYSSDAMSGEVIGRDFLRKSPYDPSILQPAMD